MCYKIACPSELTGAFEGKKIAGIGRVVWHSSIAPHVQQHPRERVRARTPVDRSLFARESWMHTIASFFTHRASTREHRYNLSTSPFYRLLSFSLSFLIDISNSQYKEEKFSKLCQKYLPVTEEDYDFFCKASRLSAFSDQPSFTWRNFDSSNNDIKNVIFRFSTKISIYCIFSIVYMLKREKQYDTSR